MKPRFETHIAIDEHDEEDDRMAAVVNGNVSDSRFRMESWMDIDEMEISSKSDWGAQAGISGRITRPCRLFQC